jgi:hypothetical protein
VQQREKLLLLSLTALFLCVQIWHTFVDQNNWPFCSYNVFSQIRGKQSQTFKIRLYESAGETRLVDVWEVLPLEFFRAISVFREVYFGGSDEARRRLASFILGELNDSPWGEFDQTYASARPAGRFVAFDFLLVDIDLADSQISLGEESILFSYQIKD